MPGSVPGFFQRGAVTVTAMTFRGKQGVPGPAPLPTWQVLSLSLPQQHRGYMSNLEPDLCFRSQFCHLLAVCSLANYLMSLCLSVLAGKWL